MERDALVFVVADAGDVEYAFEKRIPLEDVLEHRCIRCGKSMFLTRKQYAAYERDAKGRPFVFQCTRCYVDKVKAQRDRENRERN